MLNLKDFKRLVSSTLNATNLNNSCATNLITGTCLNESNLEFLNKEGKYGVAQIDAKTYKEICERINTQIIVYIKILTYLNMPSFPLDPKCLIGNMTLSIIMCRLKYYFDKTTLPANTPLSLSAYYVRLYNNQDVNLENIVDNFRTVINQTI